MDTTVKSISSSAIKACCAGLYESDWISLLFGDSLHPGGLALTERAGALLHLGPSDRLLDVAAGKGTSAIFLAQRFGCQVVGLDYSSANIAQANAAAHEASLSGRVHFHQGDAESLPFASDEFDALICECAFCTFPDKPAAAAEFARVLRPGGRLVLSDLTRSGPLAAELQGLLGWIACLADARPAGHYISLLETAGIKVQSVEPHTAALRSMVAEIRAKLLAAELVIKLGNLDLPEIDLDQAKSLARAADEHIQQGKIGYVLITGAKQSH